MLQQQDFENSAALIGCAVSAIKAVYHVEAAGSGIIGPKDRRVKILFEGHRFWKLLAKNGANPRVMALQNIPWRNVIYQFWDRSKYKGGAREWDRLALAIKICQQYKLPTDLALQSASFGAFQILGENFKKCGYASASEMLAQYNLKGEAEHLRSFIVFLQATHLDDELRAKNWASFAEQYNGPRYRENHYDTKLFDADKLFSA